MLTTLLGTFWSTIKTFLTISAFLSFSSSAFACKPGGTHFYTHFPEWADRLDGDEAARLALWASDMKKTYPNRQLYVLVGFKDVGQQTEDLAQRRAEWMKRFLVGMGEDSKGIVFGGAEKYHSDPHSGVTPSTLMIEFIPGCPNGCCTADGKPTIVPIGSPD